MTDIGATLREARMRARIDVSEIEAQTKIRAKYLRALENEEFDLLPGPTFVKSFLRTYAQALGLDARALVEEYRQRYEHTSESELAPLVPSSDRARGGGSARSHQGPRGQGSRGFVIAAGVVVVIIVLLIVGLVSGGGGGGSKPPKTATTPKHTGRPSSTRHHATAPAHHTTAPRSSEASLQLRPTKPVWVCLLADNTHKLIPGRIIAPGGTPQTYHAHRFELNLGNNAVTMVVNGQTQTVPASSSAIGYSISASGRHTLKAGTLPTCA